MKKILKYSITSFALLVGTAAVAGHDHGHGHLHGHEPALPKIPKIVVIDQAQVLADAVEALDERLHALKAPAHLIELAHHTEETVIDLVDLLMEPVVDKQIADGMIAHVRLDVRELQKDIYHNHRRLAYILHHEIYEMSRAEKELMILYRRVDLTPEEPVTPPPQPPAGETSLNGKSYKKLGEGNLVSTPNSVAGIGTLIFDDLLPQDDNNIALRSNLELGGSLKVIALAKDDLTGGVEVTLSRKAGDKLGVLLKSGQREVDVSADFEEVVLSANPLIEIDVHEHGHIIFWIDGGEEIELSFGSISGKRLGLSLNQVTVTQADVKPPKEEH